MLVDRRVWIVGAAGWACAWGAAPPGVGMVEVDGEGRRYWPRWRGPSGQGLVEGGGYPDRWGDTDGILWKVETPGKGNSSPIVWGDRIFLTTAYEQGIWPVNGVRRAVVCFRRRDGKKLWETFAPEAEAERANRKNGYASGTPACDGERVYAYLGNHGLLAVDLEGKIAWHRGLGESNAYHGTSCSPLVYRDRVIVYQDQRRPAHSFVAAFDRKTGETKWWKGREETVGWGSPVAIRAGERDEIIVSSQHRVYAYDPQTGNEFWRCEGNLVEVTPTPACGQGLLYCCSGRAGPTLAIRPGGSGEVTGSHVAWSTPKGSPFVPSPLLYGDYLYLVNDMVSVATCLEATTGRVVWQGRLGEARREGFSASPVAVDGKVFFTNDAGETFVLRAGEKFEVLGVNQFGEKVLASAAGVDGRWYFRTERHLVALGRG